MTSACWPAGSAVLTREASEVGGEGDELLAEGRLRVEEKGVLHVVAGVLAVVELIKAGRGNEKGDVGHIIGSKGLLGHLNHDCLKFWNETMSIA